MGSCDSKSNNREHNNNSNDNHERKYDNKELSSKLEDYLRQSFMQDSFSNEKKKSNDSVKELIKKKEIEELLKYYHSIKVSFIHTIKNHLYFQDFNFLQNLTSRILSNEDTHNICKKKIKNEISEINENEKSFKINYLTIMLVGKAGPGKSTLINSLLKLKGENMAKTHTGQIGTKETKAYKSREMPYLRLVDTRGIELGQYGPNQVKNDAISFIKNQQETNDINNFVHCIWYCLTGNRFEDCEIELLNSLKSSYENNKIPIILVYTQAINKKLVSEMQEYIKIKQIEGIFIPILALEVEGFNNQIMKPFGLETLVKTTLDSIKNALNGDMKSVITKSISQTIAHVLKNKNSEIRKNIKGKNISDFVKENKVKSDVEYQNYLINLYGNNIYYFLNNKSMTAKTITLIKDSELIKNYEKYFSYCKSAEDKIISKDLPNIAYKLLDMQATIEKEQKKAVSSENKRNHSDFINTTRQFLVDNLNFVSQKNYGDFIIKNVCDKLSESFELNINNDILILLKQKDIKNEINNSFLKKFNDFEKRIKKNFPKLITDDNILNTNLENDDFSYISENDYNSSKNNNLIYNYNINNIKNYSQLDSFETIYQNSNQNNY